MTISARPKLETFSFRDALYASSDGCTLPYKEAQKCTPRFLRSASASMRTCSFFEGATRPSESIEFGFREISAASTKISVSMPTGIRTVFPYFAVYEYLEVQKTFVENAAAMSVKILPA